VFNIGPGELAVILIAALIVLGPQRLPELARTLGKFLREFRRQTEDVRGLVEREFYKLDQNIEEEAPRKGLPANTGLPDAAGRILPGPEPRATPLSPGAPPGHDVPAAVKPDDGKN